MTIRKRSGAGSMQLTDNQFIVLCHLAEGMPQKQVAQAMEISHAAVCDQTREIMNRLSAKNMVHAVAIAYQKGILHV